MMAEVVFRRTLNAHRMQLLYQCVLELNWITARFQYKNPGEKRGTENARMRR